MPTIDQALAATARCCLALSACVVVLIVGYLVYEALPTLRQVGVSRFLTDESWHPSSQRYQLVPMVFATLLVSFGAMLLATPLGVACAVFAEFYAPRQLAVVLRRIVELLAGIPSVVFGLWGLMVLAPLVAELGGSGQNMLTATLVLALMILPTIALSTDIAIGRVPVAYVHGAAALGLHRSAIVWRIVLPAARRGVGTGWLLGFARALGETMAVLMVAGNVADFPRSPLSPGRTLTANMALELGYASSDHRSVLFVSGLVLMVVIAGLVLLVDILGGRHGND